MRKLLLSNLIFLSIFAISVNAQSSRVTELAGQLQQNINNLATTSAREFFGRSNNSRDQLNNLIISQQLGATAATLQLLAKENHPTSELRDATDALNDRFNRFNSDASNRSQLQQIKNDIDELFKELKNGSKSSDKNPEKNSDSSGKLFWQGTIDDEVHLIIQGNIVRRKTVSGTEYNDGIFNFTSPLPDNKVQVFVNKKEGRGTVKVIQQPTAGNDWTAIIQILDKNGGAREYNLEVYWTN